MQAISKELNSFWCSHHFYESGLGDLELTGIQQPPWYYCEIPGDIGVISSLQRL